MNRFVSLLALLCVGAFGLCFFLWPSIPSPSPTMQSARVVEAVGKHTGTVIFLHVSSRVVSADGTVG